METGGILMAKIVPPVVIHYTLTMPLHAASNSNGLSFRVTAVRTATAEQLNLLNN